MIYLIVSEGDYDYHGNMKIHGYETDPTEADKVMMTLKSKEEPCKDCGYKSTFSVLPVEKLTLDKAQKI